MWLTPIDQCSSAESIVCVCIYIHIGMCLYVCATGAEFSFCPLWRLASAPCPPKCWRWCRPKGWEFTSRICRHNIVFIFGYLPALRHILHKKCVLVLLFVFYYCIRCVYLEHMPISCIATPLLMLCCCVLIYKTYINVYCLLVIKTYKYKHKMGISPTICTLISYKFCHNPERVTNLHT